MTNPLEVPPYPTTIGRIVLPIVLRQERLFAQHLAMEQPGGGDEVDQQDPIGKDQELACQDDGESDVDGIAAEGKAAGGDEPVGVLLIDAHPKAASKGNQGPKEQRQPGQAEEHAGPGGGRGVKEYLRAYARPMERRREDEIEIKQSKRWDEEIGFVDFAELHDRHALSLQQEGSGRHHPQHEHNGQDCKICCHTDFSSGFAGWNSFPIKRC